MVIKWDEKKAFDSGAKKNHKLIGTDRVRRSLGESTLCGHRKNYKDC